MSSRVRAFGMKVVIILEVPEFLVSGLWSLLFFLPRRIEPPRSFKPHPPAEVEKSNL